MGDIAEMARIDLHYVVHKMIRLLWVGVIVGAILAGLMHFMDNKTETELMAETPKELLFENYDGNYLLNGLSSRYIVLNYTFEAPTEALAELLANRNLTDYSAQFGELILQRLFNFYHLGNIYERLGNDISEVKAEQKAINYNILYEIIEGYTDRNSSVIFKISAPAFAKALRTNEEQCAYRDSVYQAVSEIVANGELFSDLPIIASRADARTEAVIEEQNYVINVLQDISQSEEIQHGKRLTSKTVMYFAFGFVLAEVIIFLFFALNNTVKSTWDLSKNTNLEVLDEIYPEQAHCWDTLLEKLLLIIPDGDRLVILKDRPVAKTDWSGALRSAAEKIGKSLQIVELRGFHPTADELHLLAKSQVLIAVKKEKTEYSDLKELSELLRQVKTHVVGAVLED